MIERKRTRIETFEDLDVWKFCVEIRKDISDLVKAFAKEERFLLPIR
jgi:hypothetical protein